MLISILKFLILCYDRLYEGHKVFVSFYELWGIMKQKEYYTAGELARLFNIPKQTMLYYDKMGVLQPEFIAENGYRYYATPQYLSWKSYCSCGRWIFRFRTSEISSSTSQGRKS